MRTRRIPIGLGLAALAACGGGGDGGGTGPDGNEGITISVSTTALSIQAGGTGTVTLTLSRTEGATAAVSLVAEGLPSAVTGSFSPATLTGAATSSTLTLSVDQLTTPGTYRFSVRASSAGVSDYVSPAIDLSITAAPGFTLAPTSAVISVIQGTTGTVGIGITRTAGFTGAVTLALEGAPTGVSGTFQPNPAGEAQSMLTVNILVAAAAGTYPLTIRGSATGVPERTTTVALTVLDAATAGFTLSLDPASLAIAKGGTGTVTVTVTRTGGFTGPVALFSEGHPAGVTPVFDESPVTSTTSHLILTVSNQVAAGTYPITIRGEVTGLTTRRVGLELRVDETLGFSLSMSQSSVTLAPGSSPQLVTVQINRTGGFAGEVALTATGLPANVTATFSPASTTGNSVQLQLAAAAGATPGNYTLTVHGNATGITEQTAALALAIVASGTSMTWQFCAPEETPVFFAYQDGVSAFVAVPSAGGSYSLTMAAARGAVVFVQPGLPVLPEAPSFRTLGRVPRRASAAGYTTTVLYATTAELQALSQGYCPAPVSTKTLSGNVANVTGDVYVVAMGGGLALGLDPLVQSYLLSDVQDGPRDLVAGTARMVGQAAEPTKMIIRRDLNLPNGSTIPLLDFNSAEAFAPASAGLTLAGLAAGTPVEVPLGFTTGNGTITVIGSLESQTSTSRVWYGIPAGKTRTGDLHALVAHAFLDNRDSYASLLSRDVGPRTITFATEPPAPGVGVYATTPVIRLRATGTCGAPGSALSGLTTATYSQADRAWVMSETAAYLGASPNYDLRTLVLTNLSGWNESLFGVQGGSQVQWWLECSGAGGAVPTDGSVVQWLDFRGTLVP